MGSASTTVAFKLAIETISEMREERWRAELWILVFVMKFANEPR